MIRIAIDGPGGAGKSSLAKAVAKKLGIIYVDTGALYRTIGLYMTKHGIDPKDAPGVISKLGEFKLELSFADGRQVILLNGEDVGDSIRTPEISMAASAVSAIPEVRSYLLDMQRDMAKKNSVIMDGRDIGTVILPDAEVKIFLTASPEARAKRRYEELLAKGSDVKYEDVYNEMAERDRNDSTRAVAPCVPAEDAVHLDNSALTPEQTADAVLKIVNKAKKKLNKRNGYMKLHFVLAPILKIFFRVHTHGTENIPQEGGALICSNHIAIRDVFIVAVSAKRQIKFIGKKELFKVPLLGRVIRALGAVPVDRGGSDVAAIRTSVELIERGDLVSIFPQGHRNPGVDPSKTEIKNGAALIAYRSGADVIPAFINVKNHKYGFFKRVDIYFGKAIPNSELGFVNGGSEEYRAAGEKIFAGIVKMNKQNPKAEDKTADGNNI